MAIERVTVFREYPMAEGQKIHIDGGPRSGDWEVVKVSEHKVTLRCPIRGIEIVSDRFCYFAEELAAAEWPKKD